MAQKILVIEDEEGIIHLLNLYLKDAGFTVVVARDGADGLALHAREQPDLVILDIMLPALDGFEVCRRMRAWSNTPILMLTARIAEDDRINGLELGADDYLAKPFNPRELVARIRAVLRRLRPSVMGEATWTPEQIEVGDIHLDKGSRTCRVCGVLVELTTTEFDLLLALVRSSGRVVSRKDLLRTVLDRDFSPFDRSIDVHISNLRKKLGGLPEGMERIRSIRNIGYLYAYSNSPKLLPAVSQ